MNSRRTRIDIRGTVQGVGFRPFVYRLAGELGLAGWVANTPQGVSIEVEGPEERLNQFTSRLQNQKPSAAGIRQLEVSDAQGTHLEGFEIRNSTNCGPKTALILPDIATCPDCLREMRDPTNRRYLYPFTNCANCGPRFSIIESLPYDRANTTMKAFVMCPDCEREYHDPNDRRFHAQPNACPKCGPRVELWDSNGDCLSRLHPALEQSARSVLDGRILALKGIGGFQLIVDARNEAAVRRLRERKHRPDKPLAVMFPTSDEARRYHRVGKMAEGLLLSSQSPIVLLEKLTTAEPVIASSVAPRNPCLGVMLPYSPLHHLLLELLRIPIVATSGNLSDEPICIDERDALERLRGIADLFLVHNRPVARHMDDSVVRIMANREVVLRCGRGYAPLALDAPAIKRSILSVGAQLKNTVALGLGQQIFVSQHIGDLETAQAAAAFEKATADLPRLYDATPQIVASDLHPDYLSTKFAQRLESPHPVHPTNVLQSQRNCVLQPEVATKKLSWVGGSNSPNAEGVPSSSPLYPNATQDRIAVQHHYAHVLSCMLENELEPPALGICWDGTGYGGDGTVWGGEFLLVDEQSFKRAAHFRQFRLPGGEAAIRQPRRTAIGVLFELFGEKAFERADIALLRQFSAAELKMMKRMLTSGINSPVTSSAGRLFDAVAALTGIRQCLSFEGQAAMELESAIEPGDEHGYEFTLDGDNPLILDWQPAMLGVLEDLRRQESLGVIAAKFHNSLVEASVAITRRIGEDTIVLTGGCFQNKYLLERSVQRLREEGLHPFWHRRIPPNDGGIAPGQIIGALRARGSGAETGERGIPLSNGKEKNVFGHSR